MHCKSSAYLGETGNAKAKFTGPACSIPSFFAKTTYIKNFYDVTTGSNGHSAGAGYDQCTRIGSPRGKLGK